MLGVLNPTWQSQIESVKYKDPTIFNKNCVFYYFSNLTRKSDLVIALIEP